MTRSVLVTVFALGALCSPAVPGAEPASFLQGKPFACTDYSAKKVFLSRHSAEDHTLPCSLFTNVQQR